MSVLVRTAEELACGKITIEEGGRRAREATGSRTTTIAGVPTRVIPSTRDVEQEFAALAAYLNQHDYTKLERWTGAYVLVQAYLGLGDLGTAADLVRRVAVTRPLPDGAQRLVSAMIDAVLADAGTASPALIEHLLALRRGLAGSGRSDAGRVIETITGCFDREGWQYYADRDAHKILIQFSFPYGETRLVCSDW